MILNYMSLVFNILFYHDLFIVYMYDDCLMNVGYDHLNRGLGFRVTV